MYLQDPITGYEIVKTSGNRSRCQNDCGNGGKRRRATPATADKISQLHTGILSHRAEYSQLKSRQSNGTGPQPASTCRTIAFARQLSADYDPL
jgi:hypothetical protein